MKTTFLFGPAFLVGFLILCSVNLYAESIDPCDDGSQYAYGQNVGWLNFEPNQGPGVIVSTEQLAGYVWVPNIGWVNLLPQSHGGVYIDGTGKLYGYAWGANVGWINFEPNVPADSNHYGVTIDSNGVFDGWAYGQNVGWIHFQSLSPVAYKVQAEVLELTVAGPNGGESLYSGNTYQITWNTLGTVNDVVIEYSTNNGSEWTEVEPANTGNTGSYNWLVPEVTSFFCLVRVSDPCGQGIVHDTSDSVFAITPAPGSLRGWGRNDDGQADVPDGNDYIAIAGGGYYSLALKEDGSIVGWGNNTFGQTNVPAGNQYVAIAAGEWHSLAIDSNGAVTGWGDNWYGQINVPGANDFVAVAAGMYHSLAIKKDGSLVGWGDNTHGQINVPVGNDYVAIAAGMHHSMALKTNGTIVAWGDNSYGQTDMPGTSDFGQISAGKYHSLGLKLNGLLAGCGEHGCGASVPTERDYTDISCGGEHSLAIKNDGSLAAWGCNDYFQCEVPPGSDYIAVAGGGHHSLAIRTGTGETGSIELRAGWNFVSTPAKLDNSTDEVQQVFADVDTNGYPIYLYDNNNWNQMESNDLVIVLDGIWIYSTDSNTVALTFDTNPLIAPPVKALEASWNAIGHSSRKAVSADSTLCSVESKWAYLVGFNASAQAYKAAIINNDESGGVHDEDNLMYPSQGYWLYMISAGELGGLGSGTQAMGQMGLLASASESSTAGPQLPEAYYGTISIHGTPAPAGTVITAKIDGQVKGTFTTTQEGVYGGPDTFDQKLIVAGDEYDVGQTVTFWINGVQAEQSDNYDWGANTNLDLTFIGGAVADISVVLQGGGRPEPEGWQVPVTVGFFTPDANVLVDTAICEFNRTTSKSGGNALCQVMPVLDGTYDITVVSEHTLLNVKRDVVITSPTTSVDMGTLL
ncbi:MAG: RCC1 domain-containing protein, partial [Planctomycetota bacterium]